jgi:hypothetical protein
MPPKTTSLPECLPGKVGAELFVEVALEAMDLEQALEAGK